MLETDGLTPCGKLEMPAPMFHAIQWVNVAPGASGSSMMSANERVPAGAPDHARGGETLVAPAPQFKYACSEGIIEPSANAALVTVSVAVEASGVPLESPLDEASERMASAGPGLLLQRAQPTASSARRGRDRVSMAEAIVARRAVATAARLAR